VLRIKAFRRCFHDLIQITVNISNLNLLTFFLLCEEEHSWTYFFGFFFSCEGGDQRREKLLVAAIDFGSTYSGYAFSFKDDFQTNPLKIYTNNWSAEQSGGISYKAPTTVLLKPDQTFHSFGYDAEDKYAALTEADEHEGWYYFSRFKMKLMNALVSLRFIAIILRIFP
jgi:hypothetical protein